MSKFSSGDAAIYGFTLFKRAPEAVIGILIILPVILVFQTAFSLWPYLTGWQEGGIDLLDRIGMTSVGGWALLGVLGVLFSYVASYMVQGAILRPLTREGGNGGNLGLKIGMDELRLFLLSLLFAAGLMAIYLAIFIVGMVLGLAAGLIGQATETGGVLSIAAIILVTISALCALLYFSVRLSPIFAAAVGERRFAIAEAWRMTRGRFWEIFGAYVLAFLLTIAFAFAIWIAAFILMVSLAISMEGLADTLTSSETVFAPAGVALLVAGLILFGALYLVTMLPTMGVGAYVYRHWAQQRDVANPEHGGASTA
ncbi:hypothetical protein [Euryhalocaulis caribicus]|uniref:hypothetical protein n=1 Tax=Euryhalocaulis caribicus TaxID=1161401 RepID=UPI00039B89D3|nr:hypothetical protein [Euryhalocaulis caribicus]